MRLFAAIVPPAEVVAHLDRALRPIRDDALNWSRVAALHITLAFYGEVDENHAEALTTRLRRAARRCPPMELRLSGAGRFGRAVLWVGVQGDTERLRRLADSAAAAGRRLGIGRESGRPFRPHITVARTRHDDDLRPYANGLAEYHGPTWRADELVLIRSRLRAEPDGRARYERVAGFDLEAR
ncbi:RNA 2',3'-cyclic phosphodiesterase [Phytoactinopolyspora halotolerans]|uniref:RNA 2',3'-cyclic phosphodiesterase n=1 Tax=Phytoactinopolyspora halotolerans TaxID=1981512 RepID=A0A6L9S1U8_9ACTN|nr:RNA 2',3'-cyclic phosphodiesterase [Phytoactinopolyspora halotolerans]NED98958.1 RNA 2',3'-cyclic phosphodiesterase [Phytoactinopolyspora halotolerans]